ncbi:MAG TPA: hypothetical protein VF647_25235 [Longimicrobium sp.]|jgi:hypothetical protein
MRRTIQVAAVLALAASAGACSRGGRAVEDGEPATQEHKVGEAQDERQSHEASEADQHDQNPGAPRNVRDPVNGMSQAGALTALNNSGVTGNFSMMPAGNGTTVNLSVNAPTGGSGGFRVSVNQGPCSQLGAQVAEVGQVQVGGATVAGQTFTLALPTTQVMNGEHALVVYGGTQPVACASIPRNTPVPGTTGTAPPPPAS